MDTNEVRRRSRGRRWIVVVAPGLAVLPMLACSSAPPEAVASTSSALQPTQVLEATTYRITVSHIHVNRATEPTVQTSESCPAVPWTNDSVFHDVAQLGVKVTDYNNLPAGQVWNSALPYPQPCNMGQAGPNADFLDSHLTSDPQTAPGLCPMGGAFGQALLGKDLSIEFSLYPNEDATLAFALDNVEGSDVNALKSSFSDSVSQAATDIKDGSDVLKMIGPVIGAGFGSVVGIVASIAGVAGDFLAAQSSTSSTTTCSATEEASFASSCAGGLIKPPVLASSVCQGPNPPSSCPARTCNQYGCNYVTAGIGTPDMYLAPARDTLLIVDPLTDLPFTSDRLLEVTAGGPATFRFNLTYDMGTFTESSQILSPYGTYTQVPIAGNVGTAQPWLNAGCASDVDVDITIEREWNKPGPAASAKSGDMAVVGNATEVEALVAQPADYNPALPSALYRYAASPAPSCNLLTGCPPFSETAAVENLESLSAATAPVIVSRSADDTNDVTDYELDAFWADDNGVLNGAWVRTSTRDGGNGTWNVQHLASPACTQYGGLASGGIVPKNALVTATSRTPANLDVFFIGTDGNVYDASAETAQGFPTTWGSTPVTTAGCAGSDANPSPVCAGSGQPGSGVAVLARTPTTLDVFYVGRNNGIWNSHGEWTASGVQWTTQEIYGPGSEAIWQGGLGLVSGIANVTAAARDTNQMDVFWVGLDGGLWNASWNANTPGWGWSITEVSGADSSGAIASTRGAGAAGGPVSAVARQPSTLDVVFAGSHGEIEWAAFAPSSWSWGPIQAGAGQLGAGSIYSPSPGPGVGALSIVAPTSYGLQVLYLNPARQLETATWTDPCDYALPRGCSAEERSIAWQGPSAQTGTYTLGAKDAYPYCASSSSGGGGGGGGTGGTPQQPSPGAPGGSIPHPIHFM